MKVEGLQFTWNGRPKRLLGAFQHWPTHMYQRQEGVEASRDYNFTGEWIPIDLYDEIGKLTYPYLDGYGSMSWKWLDNEHLQESGRRVAVETAWLAGSHPSVVGYDVSNESFHYDPYVSGVEGQAKDGDLQAAIARRLRDAIDPDLWIFCDGNESLGGRINFCSFHYLNQGLHGSWARIDGNGINDPFHGYFHHAPDAFYLNGAANEPKVGTVLHQNPDWTYGSCACGETETFWYFDQNNGIYPCSYLGDKAAVSSNYEFLDRTRHQLDQAVAGRLSRYGHDAHLRPLLAELPGHRNAARHVHPARAGGAILLRREVRQATDRRRRRIPAGKARLHLATAGRAPPQARRQRPGRNLDHKIPPSRPHYLRPAERHRAHAFHVDDEPDQGRCSGNTRSG